MKKEREDKRSFCEGNDANKKEEEEEEKIERFFALIRSFRDARDGVRKREPNKEPKTSDKKKDSGKSLWVPSFQWEDFAEQIEFRTPPLTLSNYNREEDNNKRKKQKKDHKEEEEEEGASLDLQLSL